MTHDPMCPSELPRTLPPGVSIDGKAVAYLFDNPACQCALIVRVRADERNKIFTSLDKLADSAHTDYCRDLTCGGCEEVVAQPMQKR